ncbi:hypothetical protein CSKR_114411, partial [Clonorchis sinensis]
HRHPFVAERQVNVQHRLPANDTANQNYRKRQNNHLRTRGCPTLCNNSPSRRRLFTMNYFHGVGREGRMVFGAMRLCEKPALEEALAALDKYFSNLPNHTTLCNDQRTIGIHVWWTNTTKIREGLTPKGSSKVMESSVVKPFVRYLEMNTPTREHRCGSRHKATKVNLLAVMLDTLKASGDEVDQWLEREFTDRNVCGPNPTSAS